MAARCDGADMTETADDDLNERLFDLFVYAPLGLALEAKELIPKLAERGRGQVNVTRLAAMVGARRAEQDARRLLGELGGALSAFLGTPTSTGGAAEEPASDPGVPIPGYHALTAAEIVELLDDLTDEELERVDDYERNHRDRVTVRNRIRQRLG